MKSFMTYLCESALLNLQPLDETEFIHCDLNDAVLADSKIIAYSMGLTVKDADNDGKEVPVNPKKFPTKAVDIIIPYQNSKIELFFNPNCMSWESRVHYDGRIGILSPEQFEGFFNSDFYSKLILTLGSKWPLTDDFYAKIYSGICNKEMRVGSDEELYEDSSTITDKSRSNKDIDKDGKRDYTNSGRRIVKFSDSGVSSKDIQFYCWPDIKKLDYVSTWKDWTKIRPLCRIRFVYNGIPYGFTISVLKDDHALKYRGFRGYSLAPNLPPVQWLTKEENDLVIRLSLIDKFTRYCSEKIGKYVNLSPEEIMNKIGDHDKITINDIVNTLNHIRKTLAVIKDKKIDSFKW